MRRRNMYYATGLPGWMRLGYSPGWAGRSASGLGPCAQYLTTGQWPTAAQAAVWGGGMPGAGMVAGAAAAPVASNRTVAVAQLQAQAQALQQQLEAIQAQLASLQDN